MCYNKTKEINSQEQYKNNKKVGKIVYIFKNTYKNCKRTV